MPKLWTAKLSRATLLTALAAFALAGCQDEPPVLTVGSKDFTENMLLAEMMAQMAVSQGIAVQRAIPYGTSAQTFEALKQGRIDLYPEYNGTGLVYIGQPALTDGDQATARVRQLYAALDLQWLEPMGFSSDYVLVMRPERARSEGITRISDLAKMGPVDIATDDTFGERPLDGLGPMLRRYGLTRGKVLSYSFEEGGKDQIARALLDDDVHVAELFRTDQQISSYDLVVLEDDLSFFPVYEPLPLVRNDALATFPSLSPALARLKDLVSADDMRRMIAQVELDGRSLSAVALDFLVDKNLLQATASENADAGGADRLTVALGGLDSLSGPAAKAVRAARAVYPTRSVAVERAANPLELVVSGEARLAVAGVEAFYEIEGESARMYSPAEALGVIGYRLAHIVTRGSGPASLAEVERLGVGELNSSSDRVARMVLTGLGLPDKQFISGAADDLKAQFEAMTKGLVDAIFIMAPLGDDTVLDLMKGGNYRLLPIEGWTDGNAPLRFSFLRPAKIPANAYDGQEAAVESLSVQVVLAGPSSRREEFGAQGPGTTGTATTQPIPAATIRELSAALGSTETVDPAAPMAAALRPPLEEGPQPLVADPATSLINLAVTIFIIWLVYLLVARAPRHRLREEEKDSSIRIVPADKGEQAGSGS